MHSEHALLMQTLKLIMFMFSSLLGFRFEFWIWALFFLDKHTTNTLLLLGWIFSMCVGRCIKNESKVKSKMYTELWVCVWVSLLKKAWRKEKREKYNVFSEFYSANEGKRFTFVWSFCFEFLTVMNWCVI